MEKKDIFKNTWVGPNATTLDTLVEDWQNGNGGGGEGIPDVSGNEPSLRKKDAWVGGKNWLKEAVAQEPNLKGAKGDPGKDGEQGPKGDPGEQGPPGKDGGIPDAPEDGELYGRKNKEWSKVTGGGGGIPEAPSDGNLYGRKDESWQKVSEQVNADWNATSGKAEVLNKPTIPAPQVQTDWSATSGISSIAKKPAFSMYVDNSQGSNVFVGQTALMTSSTGTTGMFATINGSGGVNFEIRGAPVGSDYISFANSVSAKSLTVSDAVGYIRPQVQSDWTQTDTTKADYIKNKPYTPPAGVYFGEIRLLPFRIANLPEGWLVCDGYRYGITSQIGEKLNMLDEEFMADWGMTVVDEKVNAPNLLTANRGYILRAVDGINEKVGSVEQIKASTGDETIISNIGMIPAIYIN